MKKKVLFLIFPLFLSITIFSFLKSDGGEWNKIYWNGDPRDIIKIDDGYLIVGAYFKDIDEEGDAWILKIDKEGNKVWEKIFDLEGNDYIHSIDAVNNYYFICGDIDDEDVFISKIDRDGNEIWRRIYATYYDEEAKAIIIDGKDIVVVGIKRESDDVNVWLIKIDEYGNEIWNKTYGRKGYDYGYDVISIEDGYLIIGETSSFYFEEKFRDLWLLKIDKEGNEIWNKTYGFYGHERGCKIIKEEDGYLLVGTTDSISAGYDDFWLIKIDKEGNEIWNKTYGGKYFDILWDAIKTDDGYVIIGDTDSYHVGSIDFWS